MSLIAGLDSPLEHGTGSGAGMWDWNMGLDYLTGTRDWTAGLECGTGLLPTEIRL